jgi:hypothetical protein
MASYYKTERVCDECGSPFWGTARSRFFSSSCRCRRWRAAKAQERSRALVELCNRIVLRHKAGSGSYSKLLHRLLRTVAAELRDRDWNPLELLSGAPDDPVTGAEDAPGGVEGEAPNRVKWLHPPDQELELLERSIATRQAQGRSIAWHLARLTQLREGRT